jgi:phosphate-selective porin OprO/OprP
MNRASRWAGVAALLLPTLLAAQQAATPPHAVVDAGPDGFFLRSADSSFVLQVKGRVQYDSRFFLDDTRGDETDAYLLRRVGPDFQATLYGAYDFRVNIDFAGGRVQLLESYVGAHFSPALQIRAGKLRLPVGLGKAQGITTGPFSELGFPGALTPGTDIGLQAQGVLGSRLEYAVGTFNGVADGANDDEELSDSKDLFGRLFLRPFARSAGHPLRGLGFGVAGTTGRQRGSLAIPGLPVFRTTGRQPFFSFRTGPDLASTAIGEGSRVRIAPQGYLYRGPFGVLAEGVVTRADVRRGAERATLSNRAWQLTGSWVITGEPASFAGVVPAAAFDPATHSLGAWELVLRADGIRADAAAFPLFADPAASALAATELAAGVNWYLNHGVRVLVNAALTRFDAAPGATARPDERLLLTRFQLTF